MSRSLDPILAPRTIAVIGASRAPNTIGHQILANAMVAAVVPEPGVVWLMMAGLVGVGAVVRRRSA